MAFPKSDPAAALPRPLVVIAWLNALGVTVLVATELVMLSISLDWAIAGLFHFQIGLTYGLIATSFAASAAASWYLFRRALQTERQAIAASQSALDAADA
ncbi:MAG: hypothetical protein Q8P46_11305 [Hyphomicrobiales bacterium]|nr:hypothetical protein [Hyphomicrobiales bacterium]